MAELVWLASETERKRGGLSLRDGGEHALVQAEE